MPAPDLRHIRSFDDLLRYLGEELHWPVEDYGFDELTFEYDPEEVGLKDEDATKIKGPIRQLRPLPGGQPWGIFFIEFEKKKLPVVVLRRILSHLVMKKRASANKADAKRWNVEDILFISAFGDGEVDREVAFAHFHSVPESVEKPVLRVLGWHDASTPMALDYVTHTLKARLTWPSDPADATAWRERWSASFKHGIGYAIKTTKELASELARLATGIRRNTLAILKSESERGALQKELKAFKDSLIHDLDEESFADMYAQTITYGLFTAANSRTPPDAECMTPEERTAVTASDLAAVVPKTNPFLKETLERFLLIGGRKGMMDFDELGIHSVVDLLNDPKTDLEAVRRDFNSLRSGEDPVIHFYESFLAAYNKKLRFQRGVFYTPQPVVSYIVRSVHELLQTEFGLADGLADTTTWGEMLKKHPAMKLPPLTDEPGEKRPISPGEMFVQILDPATGTATFLVEVIDVVFNHLKAKWGKGGQAAMPMLQDVKTGHCKLFTDYWNLYVPAALLPRLHAFELMMAPYAIAHMKIGLKLGETGYRFGTEVRARIYLTNALEPWVKQLPLIGFDALAHEAAEVNEIKRHKRFTVVIGNPPYAQYSMNLNEAAKAHIEKFRFANAKKIRARNALQLERNLNDDYVKFLGFGSELLPHGAGILGMITNRMFLDSESLVGLREWLATNFAKLYFVDLWGSSEESRRVKRLAADENVFDILQGVAISFAIHRLERKTASALTKSREVIGTCEEKYKLLSTDLEVKSAGWVETKPKGQSWWLHRDSSSNDEAGHEFTLAEIFTQFSTLVASNRDNLVVDFDRDVVVRNVEAVRSFRGSNKDWSEKFGITLKTGWNVDAAREKLAAIRDVRALVRPIEYRSFDRRWIFFHPTLVWQTAPVSSNNVIRSSKNRVLISLGKNRAETTNGHWVSATLADKSVVSTRDNASGFPLYLFDEDGELGLGGSSGRPNISPEFLRHLAVRLGLQQEGQFNLPQGLTPEDIFHYAYAVLHSPGYRSRYAEFLKIDFPRLPLTGNLELFRALAQLGGELTALHMLESPKLDTPITEFIGTSKEATKVGYSNNTVWINASGTKGNTTAGTSGFRGVPEAVWNFHIGGYQVCEKWLKDRKDRTLTDEDITHYHKIVVALSETIRLMAEIDEVIEEHGGWPGAFQTTQA